MSPTLNWFVDSLAIPASAVVEVGVYLPESSKSAAFIGSAQSIVMVEADPMVCTVLAQHFGHHPNVRIINAAVGPETGTMRLFRAGASTFSALVPQSPALANDGFVPEDTLSFTVQSVRFEEIDPKNIDILMIDIEGAEWWVLQTLVSRPTLICVEMYGKQYVNPFAKEIRMWIRENGYRLIGLDGQDCIYISNSHQLSPIRRAWMLLQARIRIANKWLQRLARRFAVRLRS